MPQIITKEQGIQLVPAAPTGYQSGYAANVL